MSKQKPATEKYREIVDKVCDRVNDEIFNDVVNHPSHYCTGKYECIEVMTEVFGAKAVQDFCRCNAFKYLYRSDRKNGIEDIKKARWYINKFIDLEEELKNEKNTDTV